MASLVPATHMPSKNALIVIDKAEAAFRKYLEESEVGEHYLRVFSRSILPRRRRDPKKLLATRSARLRVDYKWSHDQRQWVTKNDLPLIIERDVWPAIVFVMCRTTCKDELVLLNEINNHCEGVVGSDVRKALQIFEELDIDHQDDVRVALVQPMFPHVLSVQGLSKQKICRADCTDFSPDIPMIDLSKEEAQIQERSWAELRNHDPILYRHEKCPGDYTKMRIGSSHGQVVWVSVLSHVGRSYIRFYDSQLRPHSEASARIDWDNVYALANFAGDNPEQQMHNRRVFLATLIAEHNHLLRHTDPLPLDLLVIDESHPSASSSREGTNEQEATEAATEDIENDARSDLSSLGNRGEDSPPQYFGQGDDREAYPSTYELMVGLDRQLRMPPPPGHTSDEWQQSLNEGMPADYIPDEVVTPLNPLNTSANRVNHAPASPSATNAAVDDDAASPSTDEQRQGRPMDILARVSRSDTPYQMDRDVQHTSIDSETFFDMMVEAVNAEDERVVVIHARLSWNGHRRLLLRQDTYHFDNFVRAVHEGWAQHRAAWQRDGCIVDIMVQVEGR